ncbi:MAG: S41 family peptidase [Patescibacteria group bacterium]
MINSYPPVTPPVTPKPQKPWINMLVIFGVGLLLGAAAGKASSPSNAGSSASSTAMYSGSVLGIGQSAPNSIDKDIDFKQFWDVWSKLKEKYYKNDVSDKQMFYGALQGLASSMGDPYTMYFDPKEANDFQNALSGTFSGIGAEIGLRDDHITIIAPLPETPAERAGLKAGDIVVDINGTSTVGMGVEQAVSLIRGEKGTKVKLKIYRQSNKKDPFDVELTRETIQVKSVRVKWQDKNIAVIEVTNFNTDTKEGFDKAVSEVLKKDPKGIILDLRNNPGGFLDTAVAMAGEWLATDSVVVKERRQGQIIEQLRSTGKARLRGIPTVVLVNQGSASASEIVSGALQDTKSATVVGMKTFGKGSVQDYLNLSDGSALKVTIAEWLTPSGRTINKTGLEPDVLVDRTEKDYEQQRDPQLDRALGILNGTATGTATGAPTSTATGTTP